MVQICAQQICSFDEVPPIQLLVERVGGIGRTAYRKQQHILVDDLLESQRNRKSADSISFHIRKGENVATNGT